jgi:hypothetical protein
MPSLQAKLELVAKDAAAGAAAARKPVAQGANEDLFEPVDWLLNGT